MRIFWVSNAPWTSSGYGQQTGLLLPRLHAQGNEMGCLAYYGLSGGVINFGGITMFPVGGHPYGNDLIVAHYKTYNSDLMISLMDTWVMNPEEYPMGMCWVPWYPVDHDPMPQIVRNKIAQAFKRITFSKFAVEKTHQAGLDCYYIPHGLDLRIFKPGSMEEARKNLGWPGDRWIVSTVAMNKGVPSRKNFPEMAMGFAEFHKNHPDTFYFIQSARGEGSNEMVNIPELMRNLGLIEGKDWAMPNQYQNIIGFPPEYLADLYRGSDCMMLVSAGEGFGIPLLEAQACGCPVLTGAWTANQELCMAGRMVEREDALPFYTSLASYQYKPHPGAVAALLEDEYKQRTDALPAVEQVKREYDVEILAATKWKPILAEILAAKEQLWKAQGWIK